MITVPRQRRASVAASLARNRLGTPAVVFTILAATAPLTVVAGAATTGFAVTEFIGVPIAYAGVAAVLALFAVGYTAASRHIVNAGAFSAYVTRGLGGVPGTAAAFVAVAAYCTLQVSLYGAFGIAVTVALDAFAGVSVPWWGAALAGWAAVGGLGLARVDLSGRLLGVLLGAEIAVAVVYAAVLVANPAEGTVTFTALHPQHLLSAGAAAILVGGIAGFVGFESATVYAEEVKDPWRTVPRATYTALAVAGLLYAGCSWAMTVATGPQYIVAAAQTQHTELFFNLAALHLPTPLIRVGYVLFATSLFAGLLALHNNTARYLFALGRERVLPSVLGRTGRRSGAPYAGSLLQSAAALAVLTLYAIKGWDPIVHMFFWLGVTGGLGVLILMAGTSVAVIGFFARNRRGENLWRSRVAPLTAALLLALILGSTLATLHTFLDVPADHPARWGFPAGYAVLIAAGVAWALALRRWRPDIYVGVGRGADAATSHL